MINLINDNLNQVKFETQPFNHWIYDKVLPNNIVNYLSELHFPPSVKVKCKGKRETNNFSRIFFNKENCKKYPIFRDLCKVFGSHNIISKLSQICEKDLSKGKLRIEYALDRDGFWLEPHLDIKEKLLTFLIYLSKGKDSKEWGTTIYNPDLSVYKKVPYKLNLGFMFMAGKNTWHGVPKQKIKGIRKSLIINYVNNNWKNMDELSPSFY